MSRPGSQRQRIVVALSEEIAEHGYGGTKVQDIARRAKVSLRTFYLEFENKEVCFLELYEQVTTALIEQARTSVTFDGPWREVMKHGFATYLISLEHAPRLTYAFTVELASLSDAAREMRQDRIDRMAMLLVEQVDEGRTVYPDIPSRPITPMMARAVLGGVFEMCAGLVVRNEYDRLLELADTAAELLWSLVTTPSAVPDAGAPSAGVPLASDVG